MRKYIYIVVSICCLFLCFTSCSDAISNSDSAKDKTLTLSYIVEDLETRSLNTTVAERSLEDIVFIFYNANSDAYVSYTIGSINSNDKKITLPLSNKIELDEEYKVLILGNTNNYEFSGKSLRQFIIDNSNLSYDLMRDKLVISSLKDSPVSPALPLRGKLIGLDDEPLHFVYSGNSKVPFSIKFSQIVSRFNVINTDYGMLNIQSIKVCNYKPSGYFFESSNYSDVSVIRGVKNNDIFAENPILKNGMQLFVDGGLYAFPNRVSYIVPDDKHTTCLLIAGYYQENGAKENTQKLSYYRVNIGEVGKRQLLEPNHLYTVVINNVKNSGSATEEEAMNQKESSFTYEVIENWETADNNTVSSSDGSFITVSERMIVLDSGANVSELIRVLVKPGDSWTATWKPNSGHADMAFNIQLLNSRSFNITTRAQNLTEGLNKGVITIKLDKSDLSIDLYVYQSSAVGVGPLLIVDGKTEDFEVEVDGNGELLSFEVLTGTYSGWEAELEGDLAKYATLIRGSGANMSSFQIEFKPNVRRDFIRQASVLITRKDKDPAVSDVRINFTQKHTEKLISIYPNPSETGLVYEGVVRDTTNRNGGVLYITRFRVELTDPDKYEFKIKSNNLKPYLDAFAFIEDNAQEFQPYYNLRATYSLPHSHQNELKLPENQIGVTGNTVSFCVFRTGPFDPTINGSLSFIAMPKDDISEAGYVKQEITIPISIVSNCDLGDVSIDDLFIPDRNYGTPTKKEEPYGLNATLSWGHPHRDNPLNKKFIGLRIQENYPNSIVDNTICEEFQERNYGNSLNFKLELPDVDFVRILQTKYYISKERYYFLSDNLKDGKLVGMYFSDTGGPFYLKTFINKDGLRRRYFWQYTVRASAPLRYSATHEELSSSSANSSKYIRCVGYLK